MGFRIIKRLWKTAKDKRLWVLKLDDVTSRYPGWSGWKRSYGNCHNGRSYGARTQWMSFAPKMRPQPFRFSPQSMSIRLESAKWLTCRATVSYRSREVGHEKSKPVSAQLKLLFTKTNILSSNGSLLVYTNHYREVKKGVASFGNREHLGSWFLVAAHETGLSTDSRHLDLKGLTANGPFSCG